MLTQEENELLCRVENEAPMGQLMRRHWQPICLSEEVEEPDSAPVRARVFGENLVVFRDTNGDVGVLDEVCPHRGASLALGRNEDCGLRCLYHGWKFDVHGNVTEMVSEPEASGFREKTKHKAYPVKEWAGFIWAYMGPEDSMPEFVPPVWAASEGIKVSVAKVVLSCNWAQILEGNIDSSHSSSLHSSDMVPARVGVAQATGKKWLRPSTDKNPRLQVEENAWGFRYAALRRPIQDSDKNQYIRSTVFIAPSSALIPPNSSYNVANVNVPIDDTHTIFYFIAWGNPNSTPDVASWRGFLRQTVGIDLDKRYRPLRNLDNNFWQDRQAMKAGNFTGITGFPNQDVAMWTTIGPIADRTIEHLGAGDVAVVQFRRQMLDALKTFTETGKAIGTGTDRIPTGIYSFEGLYAKADDWKSIKMKPTGF